ncbi:MAG: hypothetical protein JRH20_06905 [Deltaproteobacteria bacterium]|nr:hypothetical protein [Deltaproteobacteria bacterium]
MDQKKSGRDLSDLKARLGLTKPAETPPAGQPASQAIPPGGQAPPSAQAPGMQPPPGVQIPGMVQAAPVADTSRDPFAQAQVQMAVGRPVDAIVDRGPQIEIPIEKKKPTKLIIGVAIAAFFTVVIGYAFGGVMHARKVYNYTVNDANKINGAVGDLGKVVAKSIKVINDSRIRNKAKVVYDQQLIDDLGTIQQSSPLADAANAKKIESKLFRTNYALMDDLLIARLFKYFYDSLRLFATMNTFLEYAVHNKAKIEAYLKQSASSGNQNYGMFFAMDKGKYFIGGLVQVSAPVCPDRKPWKASSKCQLGFLVSNSGQKWSWRPGKPEADKNKMTDIVVPIPPNDAVLAGMTGKPGRAIFARYVVLYRSIAGIAALLHRDQKPVMQSLAKQAQKQKVFTF